MKESKKVKRQKHKIIYIVLLVYSNLSLAVMEVCRENSLEVSVLYPINGFLLDPMITGAAMAPSSVSVVGNSLRLKFTKLN